MAAEGKCGVATPSCVCVCQKVLALAEEHYQQLYVYSTMLPCSKEGIWLLRDDLRVANALVVCMVL
jgi:hypothetical protein